MSSDPPEATPPAGPGPVSCPACGAANHVPEQAPPVGHALICVACGAALVETISEANGVAADVLWRLFRYYDRATIHPVCPHCSQRNRALCVPANDRWGWDVRPDPAGTGGGDHVLEVTCRFCGKGFSVEWD